MNKHRGPTGPTGPSLGSTGPTGPTGPHSSPTGPTGPSGTSKIIAAGLASPIGGGFFNYQSGFSGITGAAGVYVLTLSDVSATDLVVGVTVTDIAAYGTATTVGNVITVSTFFFASGNPEDAAFFVTVTEVS